MNIQQMKHIIADAPDRALSVDVDCNWYYLSESHSLSDLRTIIEQHEEIERLKTERDSVCHLNDSLSLEIERLRNKLQAVENATGWSVTNISFSPEFLSDEQMGESSQTSAKQPKENTNG